MTNMLHIIQNDPEVPPGNLLDHIAIPYVVLYPYRGDKLPPVDSISALIVMGGAMGANDDLQHPFLVELKQLIRQAVKAAIPYLGVCLGGQLLAAACGAAVASNRWDELGFSTVELNSAGKDDRLFRGVEERFTTFQWHHDSFDIPEGGELLASSAACRHQAFRVGSCAWGVQFHPEVTEQIIRDWCAWSPETALNSDELVAEFTALAQHYEETSRRLVDNFIKTGKFK